MAWRTFWALAVFSAGALSGVIFADLEQFAVDAIVALHSAVTLSAVALIVGLMGLDATGAQIIPALKGKA